MFCTHFAVYTMNWLLWTYEFRFVYFLFSFFPLFCLHLRLCFGQKPAHTRSLTLCSFLIHEIVETLSIYFFVLSFFLLLLIWIWIEIRTPFSVPFFGSSLWPKIVRTKSVTCLYHFVLRLSALPSLWPVFAIMPLELQRSVKYPYIFTHSLGLGFICFWWRLLS